MIEQIAIKRRISYISTCRFCADILLSPYWFKSFRSNIHKVLWSKGYVIEPQKNHLFYAGKIRTETPIIRGKRWGFKLCKLIARVSTHKPCTDNLFSIMEPKVVKSQLWKWRTGIGWQINKVTKCWLLFCRSSCRVLNDKPPYQFKNWIIKIHVLH